MKDKDTFEIHKDLRALLPMMHRRRKRTHAPAGKQLMMFRTFCISHLHQLDIPRNQTILDTINDFIGLCW